MDGIDSSLIALLGVLATIYFAQRNFRATIAHEHEKARKEREFASKQAALARSAAAFSGALSMYVGLPDREKLNDENGDKKTNELSLAASELYLYCSFETIEAATKLSESMVQAYIEAAKTRIGASLMSADIDAESLRISNLKSRNEAVQQEIQALLHSEPSHSLLVQNRQEIGANRQSMLESHDKIAALTLKKYEAIESCRRMVLGRAPAIYREMHNFLVQSRKELGFKIEDGRFTTLLNDSTVKLAGMLQSFATDVRTTVLKKVAEDT
jgi:hypothetical protein